MKMVPARSAARYAIRTAIKNGVLMPVDGQICKDCGSPAQAYDHRDYLKPITVDPVCDRCNQRRGPGANSDALVPSTTMAPVMKPKDREAARAGLRLAIEAAGSISELARRLKIKRQAIQQWARVPNRQIIAVERETGIRREVLRPEIYR